jgi:hypothetical protein
MLVLQDPTTGEMDCTSGSLYTSNCNEFFEVCWPFKVMKSGMVTCKTFAPMLKTGVVQLISKMEL